MNKTLIPILADLAGIGLYLLLSNPLLSRLEQFGILNSIILGIFFVIFCMAVFGINKLKHVEDIAQPGRIDQLLADRRVMVALAVVFALAYALIIGYATGFLDSVANLNRTVLDEPAAALYLLLTPASWFGLALVYILVLAFPTGETVEPNTSRFLLVSLLSLVGVNFMAVVVTAFFEALNSRFLAESANLSFALLTFLLLVLLFLPPRLIYAAKIGRLRSLLSFVPLLALLAAVAGY